MKKPLPTTFVFTARGLPAAALPARQTSAGGPARQAAGQRWFVCLAGGLLCLGFLRPGPAWGVPANPEPVELSQPDGTKIKIALKGDEFYHWNEDDKGYTVFKDTATKNWVYGEKDANGTLRAGKYKVGADDPVKIGLQKHQIDIEKAKRGKALRNKRDSSSPFNVSGTRTVTEAQAPSAPAKTPILTGTMKNLVILAKFSDQTATYTQAEFNSLFNDIGYTTDGAVGSVKDYYNEISYNKLTVDSTVSQWVTLPNGYAYYGANDANGNDVRPREMVSDAINALDAAGFDFSTVDSNGDGMVDGLTVIHSGQGEEAGAGADYIWSHQWSLADPVTKDGVQMQTYHTEPELRDATKITRIGVICHETGHFLGLPDLYDYGGDSAGVGDFCLMASGSWNGGDGKSPAHMSAWCKKYLGWAAATQLSPAVASYSLPRIEISSTALYLLRDVAFPADEYFLVENRQGPGFDSALPGTTRGILIWHVDESVANNDDQTHYMVDLEEAHSGDQHLEKNLNSGDDADYFRSGNNTSFGDSTTPNSISYGSYNLKRLMRDISASGTPMSFYLDDPTSPANIANVYDGTTGGLDIAKTGSSTTLSANWTISNDPESGLKAYWYAIGTSPGLTNVVAWKDNGLLISTTASGLSLTNGVTYYFSVKAVNGVDMQSSVTSSNGQWVDTAIPLNVPYVYDGLSADTAYVSSLNRLSANWGASASGNIAKYWYAIGTAPGGTDTLAWTDNALALNATMSGLGLSEGATYYFAVKAQNTGGFESNVTASNGQKVDTTSPTARVLITSSTGVVKTGTLTLKLIVNEANTAAGTPVLAFTPSGGASESLPLSYLVSSTWTGSTYIESFFSTGTAAFAFSVADPAGNTGSVITAGGTFVIDTSISGISGGSVVNRDSFTVVVPAGGYSGGLVIRISTVSASRTAAADAATHDSYPVYTANLTREFTAKDAATGAPVADFAAPLTLKLCYSDADNDERIDGNYIAENLARLYLLDETLNIWTPVTDALPSLSGNYITVQTAHFSVYTIRVIDISKLGMSAIKAYPNPCYFDKPPFTLTIAGLPLDASEPLIYIYNAAGELVRSLAKGDGIDVLNKAVWDGKNKSGGRAASGLYIYVVRTANYGKASGKFYIFW
ncbi:MAG: M6 family metalloprotease domain-containing protein [Elusimicrobia bacterium]|nr:M6 family metalloprotease domain-containing protein [Elusimicrobiota bacterium]